MDEDSSAIITNALAEYFECDPSEVGAFVVCCERQLEGGTRFSSAWSAIPHWHLLGFVDELRTHIENHRAQLQVESVMNGG